MFGLSLLGLVAGRRNFLHGVPYHTLKLQTMAIVLLFPVKMYGCVMLMPASMLFMIRELRCFIWLCLKAFQFTFEIIGFSFPALTSPVVRHILNYLHLSPLLQLS